MAPAMATLPRGVPLGRPPRIDNLLLARSVAGLAGVKEQKMGSSEKKRAREQSAAVRRDRAVKKRAEKSSAPSGIGEASGPVRVEMLAPTRSKESGLAV